jgi:copper(I)-binding protein
MITIMPEDAMRRSRVVPLAFALMLGAGAAHAEGKLGVFDAWIRQAPPGATMLAGYATLKNAGDAPITVWSAQSDAFRKTSVHETIVDNDVAKMREVHRLVVPPGGEVRMEPGGRHLMLMQPRHEIVVGDKIEVVFLLRDGTRVQTYFNVLASDASD